MKPLRIDGRVGSIYRDSLNDLWNAAELVQVRAAMARGEKPENCRLCWDREAAGGVSRRLLTNTVYRQLGGRLAIESLPMEGAGTGYSLERRPDWFILELGNVCNLRCRSCTALSSSRIAADPVHNAWSPVETEDQTPNQNADRSGNQTVAQTESQGTNSSAKPLVLGHGTAWFNDVDAVADMIASGADGNAMLSLMGGEPFLIDSTWRLLSALVDRGVAKRLVVGLATNGQHRSAELERLAPHFRGLNLALSIDAHGKLHEYLRYGSSWSTLVENLRWFQQVPNLGLVVVPTFQNYNVLNIVTLLRFLDERELPLAYNMVSWPTRLRPVNVPANVRRIAIARLRAYLEAECKPANVPVVRSYCETLEDAGEAFDADLFGEFMAFTNDLDADRGESLADAEPELAALIRAGGVEWSDVRRYAPSEQVAPGGNQLTPSHSSGQPLTLRQAELMRRVNRTVSPNDVTFAGFEAIKPGTFFSSGLSQVGEIDTRLREYGHPGLVGSKALADFACHYGRMTRALRAAEPHAAIYACDIDPGAVQFCAEHLGAIPVITGWRPDQDRLPYDLDGIVCVSLLTHTPLDHWRSTLQAWARILKPGGFVAFTFLSENYLDGWLAGTMEHYGSYPDESRSAAATDLREKGFGFASLTSDYGGEPLYGIAFATCEVVRREIAASGLELLAIPAESGPVFAQNLVLARKPIEQARPDAKRVEPPAVREVDEHVTDELKGAGPSDAVRDVSLVALFDPRCYAPAQSGEGSHTGSVWAGLAAADPPRPLPTELGFADPRVPEVREAQAAMAREHGIDAFCYLYIWGAGSDGAEPATSKPGASIWRRLTRRISVQAGSGPRWDAPLRDLIATGRPDFPFCLMLAVDESDQMSAEAATRMFDDIAAGVADRRYLRIDGRILLMVRDVALLIEPRAVAAAWRAAARARGLGELHLCAAEPALTERPEDIGFDSFLETPLLHPSGEPDTDQAGVIAAALGRPWPTHRLFRRVECRRDNTDPRAAELYELWLRSALDATRTRGEKLVFLDGWNCWLRGAYLEPDDRDGRAALLATRRAARGPASGLVLLRQLRDELGDIGGRASAILNELEQVLDLHEHSRDRLLASVEAALGRNQSVIRELPSRITVDSRQLPPSISFGGRFSLDAVGSIVGAELHKGPDPVAVDCDEIRFAGWSHTGNCGLDEVDLFLVLESSAGTDQHIFRIAERVPRHDVASAFPEYPENCGFDSIVNVSRVPPGTYQIAIVQRTPHAAYRDATEVMIRRERRRV